MTTNVDEANECPLCIKDRVKAGEAPEKLVTLPIRTLGRNLPVKVCATCDSAEGDGVVRIALGSGG